jgi:retron-type reverse transcriptase
MFMTANLTELHLAVRSITKKIQKRAVTDPPSIKRLRKEIEECAADLRRQIVNFAKDANLSPLFVLRNLVATSHAENLLLLRSLLEYWKNQKPFKPESAHQELIKALTPPGWRSDFFRWLMLGGKLPATKSLASFFGGHPLPLLEFEREFFRKSEARRDGDTFKLLREVFAKSKIRPGKASRQIFLAEGFLKGLSPLDEVDFNKLSSEVKRWLLADVDFSKVALTSDLHIKILSNPLAFQESPEAIAVHVWLSKTLPIAFQCLSNRNFQHPAVAQLLQRSDVGDHSNLILSSLRKRKKNPARQRHGTALKLPDGARTRVENRTGNALAFFSKPVTDRLSVIGSMNHNEIEELAHDVSSADWFEAIQKCGSKSALKRIRNLVLNDPQLRKKVFRELIGPRTSRQCFGCFIKDLMEESDATALLRLVSKSECAFAFWKPECSDIPKFREVIEKYCDSAQGFTAIESHAPKDLMVRLFESEESWICEWRHRLALHATSSRTPIFLQRLRYHLLRSCPNLIGETIGWKISEEDFHQLLTSVLAENGRRRIGAIFDFTEPGGITCWERYLQKPKYSRMIRPLIRRERPDLLARIAKLDALARLANPAFQKKLKGILEEKKPYAPLGISRSVLREMVPWAHKTWRNKPTLAIAFELALAFSLRDARYLVSLCAERWKFADKDRGGHSFDHHYQTHPLPKKSGGSRVVTVPDAPLKRLQRRILRNGFDEVFIHPSAHGFKRGCSILTNATPHVGKSCVVNVDVESFFPSTRYPLILKACSHLLDGRLSEGARHVVADICSYKGGLPTGAPTSPAIANLVLRPADASLTKAATDNGITYTRYADDLTFSGDTNAIKILPFAKRILAQLGYQLKEKKTNIFRRGRRQMVTGLVVNEKTNLPRGMRRRLRAAVHQMTKDGNPHWQGQPMSSHELLGRLAFLNLVQPQEALALKFKMTGSK